MRRSHAAVSAWTPEGPCQRITTWSRASASAVTRRSAGCSGSTVTTGRGGRGKRFIRPKYLEARSRTAAGSTSPTNTAVQFSGE